MEKQNSKHIIVLDGNSLLFRSFYATYYGDPSAIMKTSNGIPTNAIFAFSNMMVCFLSKLKRGDSILVAFDKDSHTFRKEEFSEYKANRKPTPQELVAQFPISRELMSDMGVFAYEEHGIEADDIAGTVAKKAEKDGYKVDVYTSDKDYLQLVSDSITVHLIRKGLSDIDDVTPTRMVEEFGFTPSQIIDYKGLRGDSSDNLPGIPGVGEKTATKLIQEYSNFDNIISAAKEGKIKGKLRENIINNEALGRQCYSLATMKLDCDLPFTLEDLIYKGYDYGKMASFCSTYELKKLLGKMPEAFRLAGSSSSEPKLKKAPKAKLVASLRGIEIKDSIGVSLDLDEQSYNEAEVKGIGISNGNESFYLTASSLSNDLETKRILEDESVKKSVYDGKKIEVGLAKIGLKIKGIDFDLLLSAYLLDSSLPNDSRAVYSSFGANIGESSAGEGLSLFEEDGPNEKIANEAFYALRLKEKALSELEKADAKELLLSIEQPLSRVLAKMEIEGFPLNKNDLESIGLEFRKKKEALEKEINMLAGHPFNPSSPKQIAEVLYDELGLKGPKSRSTSVDVLQGLAYAHPLVGKILEYRKYAKLVGTYIDGLLPHIAKDGKIHTCFNQAQTSTGRLSSSNPNLQNISTRDEESKLIRKAFHYEDSSVKILSLDYSQIELRILAALSHCQSYINVFKNGHDVHSETARKIFSFPDTEEVPHELRRKAKAINFAIVYGTTAYGLSEQIQGSPQEAKEIIEHFNREYPEIQAFGNATLEEADKLGYVHTMTGRRRYLPEIHDPNYMKREAAKRAALNAPVQGSAADLIKVAMLKVDEFLSNSSYKTKMVLQIHDELLFAVPSNEVESILPKLKQIMENAIALPVPLTVEGSVGQTWYEAKD